MSISDIIEQYLKKTLHATGNNMIEIKRNEIAARFECVPSQINYVINTRFTTEKGYVIESKRGGGGYIRIFRVEHQSQSELLDHIINIINPVVSQQGAEDVLRRLYEKEVITKRELRIVLSTIDRKTLALDMLERDKVRARILTAILNTLKFHNK